MSHVIVLSEVPAQVAAYTLPVGIEEAIAAMGEFPLEAAASAAEAAASADYVETLVGGFIPGAVAIYTAVTANITLEAGKQYRLRATSGAITLTLPASPATGATIRIVDGETVGNGPTYTLARNGQTIMSLAEDATIDTPGIGLEIWFNGTTWRLF